MADELEEDINTIKPIYDIALECYPDADSEKIYQLLTEIKHI